MLVHGQQAQPVRRYPHLSCRPDGKFRPVSDSERLEALRWILFDNQKRRFLAPIVFSATLLGRPATRQRSLSLKAGSTTISPFWTRDFLPSHCCGERHTIADLSLVAYLYYPADESGFDITASHKNIAAWLERIKALPGWKHP